MTTNDSTPASSPTTTKRTPRSVASVNGTPIEQAIALREALMTASRQSGELIKSLKRHKRQTRLVQSTLDSLKALQKVAG